MSGLFLCEPLILHTKSEGGNKRMDNLIVFCKEALDWLEKWIKRQEIPYSVLRFRSNERGESRKLIVTLQDENDQISEIAIYKQNNKFVAYNVFGIRKEG